MVLLMADNHGRGDDGWQTSSDSSSPGGGLSESANPPNGSGDDSLIAELLGAPRVSASGSSDGDNRLGGDDSVEARMERVFMRIGVRRKFGPSHVGTAYELCGLRAPRASVLADMIWEVDERGRGWLSADDLVGLYHRVATDDQTPPRLADLVEFLLFADADSEPLTISVQLTMKVLTRRFGARAGAQHRLTGVS